MPSRRHKSSSPASTSSGAAPAAGAAKDPAAMFAAALKESDARDRSARERKAQEDAARAQRAAEIAAHDTALSNARRDLELAIEAVRAAKRNGRSTVEADAAWKSAKARVIELETGAPPAWAPPPDVPSDERSDNDSPVDDDAVAEQEP
jgi:hypothetical protein